MMRIQVSREPFVHAFQIAAAVTSGRSTKDILRNVKLQVDEEGVVLMGTDLEVGVRVVVPGVKVEAQGAAVLPTDRVGSIVRENQDKSIVMESDGTNIRILSSHSQFQLPSKNPDEFPEVPRFEEQRYVEVAAALFRQMIRRTVFATDTESSRYALGGVLLEFDADRVTAVGTDGRRLARQEGPMQQSGEATESGQTTIIPARSMQLLDRIAGDSEENIQLAARENDVLVRSGNAMFYSRLVEGRFPRWRDVFPKQPAAAKVELPVAGFHGAVRQAAIVTSEERRGVEFSFEDGKLSLAAHGAEFGESLIEMPISYDGPKQTIDLDPRYLGEFLRVLDPDKMFVMELRGSDSAAVCVTDDGYGYVVMPLARDQR